MALDDELFDLSGVRLAALVRDRAISALELVTRYIEAVERVNPRLNAVVATRFDEARDEARRVDAAIAEGRAELPPYAGVPCTIKECIALEGMRLVTLDRALAEHPLAWREG